MEWKIERKEQMYQYIETFYVQKERERWKTEMVKRDLKVVEILDIDKAAKSEARKSQTNDAEQRQLLAWRRRRRRRRRP